VQTFETCLSKLKRLSSVIPSSLMWSLSETKMTSPNNSVKLSVVPVVPRRRCRSLRWPVDGVSTTRLRVSDTTRLSFIMMLLTLTQLAHTGLAASLPAVDFGRWFFAEHRCPQTARKNFSFDVPEHSTDGLCQTHHTINVSYISHHMQ